MSIVLITGATGFIGRHCLERLLSVDCEIHAVTRQPNASGGHAPGGERVLPLNILKSCGATVRTNNDALSCPQ